VRFHIFPLSAIEVIRDRIKHPGRLVPQKRIDLGENASVERKLPVVEIIDHKHFGPVEPSRERFHGRHGAALIGPGAYNENSPFKVTQGGLKIGWRRAAAALVC
tara:strand:+ start:228 stop:539 length:312 start_codon:yes stop_codon:yes gene_type:complete